MEREKFLRQFQWRFLLVRIVVNGFALAGTAIFVPKIDFVGHSLGNWLLMAVMLGVLNALLKPILQFLTLQFIFVTYGLVIVLVNALLLWALSFLFPNRFAVESIWWLLLGGLVLGLLSSFLESLLGLTMPIVPDEPPELRMQVEQQARQVEWLAPENREIVSEAPATADEPPPLEATAAEPAILEQDVEPSLPVQDGQADDEVPVPKVDTPDEMDGDVEIEPTPEPEDEQKEDLS